jgi:GNAT superfamily N-acetyltransferase
MATLPEHQGGGLGRRVLTDLLAQIDGAAPAGAYVTLMADGPGRRLYESVGFVETAPESLGMRLAR